MRILDDVCLVPPGPQSHQVQASIGHLRQFHSSDDLSPVDLRLPGGLHPLQMVDRLEKCINPTPVVVEHADSDVFVTWIGRSK